LCLLFFFSAISFYLVADKEWKAVLDRTAEGLQGAIDRPGILPNLIRRE
jgi:hypothetical protein